MQFIVLQFSRLSDKALFTLRNLHVTVPTKRKPKFVFYRYVLVFDYLLAHQYIPAVINVGLPKLIYLTTSTLIPKTSK